MTLLEILHDCWNGEWEANYDFVVQNEYGVLLSCSNDNLVYRGRAGYWQNNGTAGHIHIVQHSPTMVADDFATKIVTKQEFEEYALQKVERKPFKCMLFEPENEMQSRLIQEKLFQMGYAWFSTYRPGTAIHTDSHVLFTTTDGFIFTEIHPDLVGDCEKQMVTYSAVEFAPIGDLIEIDGHYYSKEDVAKLVSSIKPII